MKFVSKTRSAFMKAAGHPALQMINEHAAKITAITFGAADTFLMTMNYLKNGSIKINMPPANADQWTSLSGLTYITASAIFMGGDKFNWIKKPVGALSCVGGLAMAAAAGDGDSAFYVTGAAPVITGLSMLFEEQANRAAEKISSVKNYFAKAAQVYLDYPVATMAGVQMVSAMSALGQGIMDPQQHLMIPYALSWIFGNMVFALTDNNVRSAIRSAANADNAPQAGTTPS